MRYQKYSMMLFVLCFSVLNALGQTEILTRVNGGASWEPIPSGDGLGPNVDLSLTGTVLTVSDGTNSDDQDLSTLQDGTGTDDQTIDVFGMNGTSLQLSIEDDGQNTKTVNLGTLFEFETNYGGQSYRHNPSNIIAGGSLNITANQRIQVNNRPVKLGMHSASERRTLYANHIRVALYTNSSGKLCYRLYNEGTSAVNLPSLGFYFGIVD